MAIDFTVRTVLFLIALVCFLLYCYPWPRFQSAWLGAGLALMALAFAIR